MANFRYYQGRLSPTHHTTSHPVLHERGNCMEKSMIDRLAQPQQQMEVFVGCSIFLLGEQICFFHDVVTQQIIFSLVRTPKSWNCCRAERRRSCEYELPDDSISCPSLTSCPSSNFAITHGLDDGLTRRVEGTIFHLHERTNKSIMTRNRFFLSSRWLEVGTDYAID